MVPSGHRQLSAGGWLKASWPTRTAASEGKGKGLPSAWAWDKAPLSGRL